MNLRGEDIPYNPVFKSYLLLEFDNEVNQQGYLYIDPIKISFEVSKYLSDNNVKVKPYEEIHSDLAKINKKILINRSTCNYSLFQVIPQNLIINEKFPLKALKVFFFFFF